MSEAPDEKERGLKMVTLQEWMVSCGIMLDRLAEDLNSNDAIYGDEWQWETIDRVQTTNRVGRRLFDKYEEQLRVMWSDLPEGVFARLVSNPDYIPPTETPSDASDGVTRDSLDDLPF